MATRDREKAHEKAQRDSRAVTSIARSQQYAQVVEELCGKTGRDVEDIRTDAIACLEEPPRRSTTRRPLPGTGWGAGSRVRTTSTPAAALPELRELDRKHSLVFLPNHRSYLDPLVLRTALSQHGFRPNYVLGGINLALWPLSELGRRAAIFIRRTTRDDPVYPAMLRLYLGYLLRRRANLEWYFEGGRTRTGKLRPPKMGVLKWLVDAFVANGAEAADVLLVPVAIVYDQQHEVLACRPGRRGSPIYQITLDERSRTPLRAHGVHRNLDGVTSCRRDSCTRRRKWCRR